MLFKKQIILLTLVLALSLTAELANADFVFGTPTKVPNINSSSDDVCPEVSADGLSLFIGSKRPGGYGGFDLWVSTRATTAEDWNTPVNLGPAVNSSRGEHEQSISHDGLELYFSDYGGVRPGGVGNVDTWVMTRAATDAPWGEPVNLGPPVNSSAWDGAPSISADGLSLFFHSGRSGNLDLWVATRETVDDEWGAAVNLGPTVNSPGLDADPDISADGLRLFFASNRAGGYGGVDLWMAARATRSDPWGAPVNLGAAVNGPLNGYNHVSDAAISPDGSTLYFGSGAWPENSTFDLWQSSINPIVDFNRDGIVDVKDVVIMTEHWGENYSLCDIGPTAWGDGIVDVQDLIVLTEYIEPIDRILAHWMLDETEGMFAYDSAAENDAIVIGNAVWQPDGGQVEGALQFDGIDDYIAAPLALNPAYGPFSIFVWAKGGAPGQAIISTPGGPDWLSLDLLAGHLMTGLTSGGRQSGDPLISESIVTDDNWHRVGFTWGGTNRILYVDDVEVAHDTLSGLNGSDGGLYIGAGNDLAEGSFWSGMIDDVLIYDRAIEP